MNLSNLGNTKRSILKYKYVIVFMIFFLSVSLFSENSCYERKLLKEKKELLVKQKHFYEEKIKKDSIRLEQLKTNNSNLEKFARENYLMSEKDEDVFVISD